MKFIICCFLLIFSFTYSYSQNTACCKDSSRQADTYFACNTIQYEPVCGCDGITYRNSCAAENWGGLINNFICLGWTEGTVCGNFDFDFTPTGIQYQPVQFSIFMKSAGSATLYIYNRFGALLRTDYFNAYNPGQILKREINLQELEIGVYIAMVVVNGEKLTKKFGKVIKTTE